MIIVIKKADLACQPFSNLKTACEHFGFVYNTLVRKEFPIDTNEYILHQKKLIKTQKAKNNTANLRDIN
jgi:hypothetical protein